MLSEPQPVTAIVAGNDTIAIGVLEAAGRRGIRVAEQLFIIGFDDMPLADSPLVGLTSIRQPVEALVRTAARRLVERVAPAAWARRRVTCCQSSSCDAIRPARFENVRDAHAFSALFSARRTARARSSSWNGLRSAVKRRSVMVVTSTSA